MKSQINPVVAIVVIALVVLVVGAFIWKSTSGTAPGGGKRNTTLDLNKMEKDPVKLMQGLQELKQKEDAQRARQ